MITGVAAWSIWGGDIFPQNQPQDSKPSKKTSSPNIKHAADWSVEDLRAWLHEVSAALAFLARWCNAYIADGWRQRGLDAGGEATSKSELVAMVETAQRAPK